ncbi:2-oxoglutarate dehydrogenase E1 component [Daejeonella sp. H1SJ63]|jgi:2-oxoglutarate dehydrogenase E1 component|uniref:2-oxoglutarate dehydrogenase E1 component n=1 Tax=Daejeonella sp. H1SJ63 TaxID=3034145 RepID=UPI0023EDB47F|nr:2-oxoglutarate dehydrogenase E1 component [Daejeonella sp. H1SJ63]
MNNLSYLSNADSAYIDSLYQSYKEDPESIDFGWQKFFEGFDFGRGSEAGVVSTDTPDHFLKEIKVLNLINGYRQRGHLFTKTNPVRERRSYFPGKELETFGLSDADLETVFNAGVEVGLGPAKLKDILALVEQTYCQSIGVEYKYLRNPEKLKWFEQRMEFERNTPKFDIETKKRILSKLNEAVVFENFLGTKFLGQKRFSLEGAESVIPALDSVIHKGAELGIDEFVIGMAHRGRLNVLANIMHKTYKDIFSEFEGKGFDENTPYGGDVKYHLGYSMDVNTFSGKSVHLSLCPNPSHLETVDAVVQGMVRSKIDFKYEGNNNRIAPILIHGDASLAGQGITYEVIQMAKLDGYKTGGSIHLVINNQVGFTTNYKDARSSTYCTDLAKVTLSPVFHVNGDDVEALVYAINMAVEYRQKYHNDVFIDILCYRRYGHNEADEPKFTQPLLYKAIEKHANPREIYNQKLMEQGSVDANLAKEMEKNFRALLQERLNEAKEDKTYSAVHNVFGGVWKGLELAKPGALAIPVETRLSSKTLLAIAKEISTLPSDKKFFKKIEKLFEERRKMADTKVFDWAMGELMAYGSLIQEGFSVRLSGQDVERGTFSHRHAVITLEDSEEEYVPLSKLDKGIAKFDVYNSHLSEYGVLGFEYGYALANPMALTIWEAQFGDFMNGAQIVIDQFITSAETKWQRSNGLVMLLPHGFEGQGPEHSSARIERFMEACADENIQVANCTTPANFFHLLRRQMKRNFRKPLVVFTPKSLLRSPQCVSNLEEFTDGKFRELIDDSFVKATDVKRVLFCSGKIYYDLLEKQRVDKRKDVAIVRLEQLYPLPYDQIEAVQKKYSKAKEFFWVQEEPENMGAWPYISRKFRKSSLNFEVISRKESSSTATGYAKQHIAQQLYIVTRAFDDAAGPEVKKQVEKATKKIVDID